MHTYFLTVFKQTGEKLLDESFEAKNDIEAKQVANSRLIENDYQDLTHRCVTSKGKLILFHR